MAAQQYRTLKGGTVSASPNPSIGYLLQGPSLAHEAVLDTGPGSRTIAFVDQYGTPGHEVYGLVSVGFVPGQGPVFTGDSLTLTHGVTLSYGHLNIFGDMGGTVTLDGASTVTNDSTFTATGGRSLTSPFVLNGSMTVSNQSTADFHNATLEGHGTVNISTSSNVDVSTVLAGLHFNVAKGGELILQATPSTPPGAPQSFHGTINEAAGAHVLVYGAQSAVREIFHTATGTLDLLNKSGAQVASLQFAPGSREYAAIGPGNQFAAIATSPLALQSHALPTTFTH